MTTSFSLAAAVVVARGLPLLATYFTTAAVATWVEQAAAAAAVARVREATAAVARLGLLARLALVESVAIRTIITTAARVVLILVLEATVSIPEVAEALVAHSLAQAATEPMAVSASPGRCNSCRPKSNT